MVPAVLIKMRAVVPPTETPEKIVFKLGFINRCGHDHDQAVLTSTAYCIEKRSVAMHAQKWLVDVKSLNAMMINAKLRNSTIGLQSIGRVSPRRCPANIEPKRRFLNGSRTCQCNPSQWINHAITLKSFQAFFFYSKSIVDSPIHDL